MTSGLMRKALLFPGQGAQFVGMGKALAESDSTASAVFAEANEALQYDLGQLCFEGPEATLNSTEMAQPALLTHGIAVLRAVEAADGPFQSEAMAGHSLGEWTALVAAGALTLSDAVRLVRLRGQLMQEAVPHGVGAMAAILGLEAAAVEAICADAADGEVVVPATYNGSGNIVVSGHAAAVERAAALAKERGAAAVKMLPVSAPFHCPLMSPVADRLGQALADVEIAAPEARIRSTSVDGWLESPEEIRVALIQQLTAPVRWEQCLRALVAEGIEDAPVIGAGRAMTRMVKRMRIGLKPRWVHQPEATAS